MSVTTPTPSPVTRLTDKCQPQMFMYNLQIIFVICKKISVLDF